MFTTTDWLAYEARTSALFERFRTASDPRTDKAELVRLFADENPSVRMAALSNPAARNLCPAR